MPHKSVLAGHKNLKALGAAVRNFRKERGLSQEELAVDADVERSYLGAIERAEVNVTIVVLGRLCKALKIKLSDLMLSAKV